MKIRILGMIALFLAITLAAGPLPAAAGDTEAGNCLTFPVIWAEGVEKTLRGTGDMDPVLNNFVYWWSAPADEFDTSNMCYPDPDNSTLCDDSVADSYNVSLVPVSTDKVYPQQDLGNTWQAGTATATERVQVDLLDWGDNMESVDWYTKSKVRTEMVLLEDTTVVSDYDLTPEYMSMTQYLLKHVSGWGITEKWGLSTTEVLGESVADEVIPNVQSTVYSPCARFTIQKLMVQRDDPLLADLVWVPETGWIENTTTEGSLIRPPIFNRAVWDAGDGPDYYSAEINVKGKVMYGYNWDLGLTNDMTIVPPYTAATAAGDYRVTFSFDDTCGEGTTGPALNTFFSNATGYPVAKIFGSVEEDTESSDGDSPDVGGTAVIDYEDNLTYMDVRIIDSGNGDGQNGGDNGNGGVNGQNGGKPK